MKQHLALALFSVLSLLSHCMLANAIAESLGYMAQPVVIKRETVMVTQPVRRVTELTAVQTVLISSHMAMNSTAAARNGTRPASLDPNAHRIMPTASA